MAIDVAPQSAIGYLALGRLRFYQKRFPDGVPPLEQALQYDPDSVDALHLLVSYDMMQKQPEKAMALVNQQIAKRPQNSGFYVILAELQMQNKNLDQAAATAQKAMQLNSGHRCGWAVYANRGHARANRKRHCDLAAVGQRSPG
jgi:tetratricopeptide (TPR) repeat protein